MAATDDPQSHLLENGVEGSSANHVDDPVPATDDTAVVIFVDPIGSRWEFPFESCKTWTDMAALIKDAFVDSLLPEWLVDEFDESYKSNSPVRNFAIKRLKPGQATILPSLWEKMVKPGWEVTIEFFGMTDLACSVRSNKKAKNGIQENQSEQEGEAKESTRAEDEKLSLRSYVMQYFQRDQTSYPNFVCERSYQYMPIVRSTLEHRAGLPAVFQIIQKVLFSPRIGTRPETEYEKLDESDIVSYISIKICSPKLFNALRDIVSATNEPEGDPNLITFYLRSEDSVESDFKRGVFLWPFKDLYHYREELIEYKNSKQGTRSFHSDNYNKECDEHIDNLLEYLYDEPTIKLREAEELWNQEIPKTRFDNLWLLLKPGITVFVKDRFGLNAYVIDSVTGGPGSSSFAGDRPYAVECWNLEFDGNILDRSPVTFNIPVFDGERDITQLRLYPTRFHKNEKKFLAELIDRGKRYVKMVTRPSYREYSGPSYYYGARKFEKARAVIDHICQPWTSEMQVKKTLRKNIFIPCDNSNDELDRNCRIRSCECEVCQSLNSKQRMPQRMIYDDYKELELESERVLTDHQYLLCHSHVYGFLLKDRIWDFFEVQGLQTPALQINIIDNLVIDQSNKDIIKAVCDTYSTAQEKDGVFFADFVKGKGEGQIILLHGPPGTGKTLTAESVAEATAKPLLSVTAADLGHEPISLEENLLKFFTNATRWDGIVLLDEADVYLQRRSASDLHRNSVVSVFLRALDYFQGILFITTNRIGVFDEAFMSRIHLQIGYDPLDHDARAKIWDTYLDRLKHNKKQGGREFEINYQVKKYIRSSPELRELNWNGREIRNAFQTAVALASSEAKKEGNPIPMLGPEHIDQVVTMSTNFKNYMKEALKASPEELAAMANLRADRFQGGQASGVSQFNVK